jgi:hypothetical protein
MGASLFLSGLPRRVGCPRPYYSLAHTQRKLTGTHSLILMHKLFFLFLLVHGQIIILFSLPMQYMGHGGSICLTLGDFVLIILFLYFYLFIYLLDINRKENQIEPRQEAESTTQPRDFVLFFASEKKILHVFPEYSCWKIFGMLQRFEL